jgi:glycosyltransferase involved in cell wall biosynthesis
MRIAYYSPLPPERTGIAEYSELLLPELGRRVEIAVVARGNKDPRADTAVYHIGNNPEAHAWIVDALRRRSGVVVLHDFVLHHLVAGMTLGRGDWQGYLNAMEREEGLVGRLLAQALLEGRLPPLWETRPEDFPLAGEVLDRATGLIVHSRYVEERVRGAGYDGPLWRIPHPAWTPPEVEPERVGGAPLVGCFGNLNPSKRLPELLAAFSALRGRHPDARLLLVGGVSARYELPPLSDGVERIDYVDEPRLWALMRACDVHVSLRFPTMGETSGSAVRSLSLGKPLVVSDIGWFTELPGDVALKVPLDEREVDVLAGALELAAEHAPTLGAAARAYAERELDVARVAERYVEALETAAGGDAVADAVVREVAEAAAAVGIAPDDPQAAEIARRLAEAGIAP